MGAQCWYKICEFAATGRNVEQRMRSRPLLLRLGAGEAPDMALAGASAVALELDTASYGGMLDTFGERMYKAADWRCRPHALAGRRGQGSELQDAWAPLAAGASAHQLGLQEPEDRQMWAAGP